MINTKRGLKKAKIIRLWGQINILIRIKFLLDLVLAFLTGGTRKVKREIEAWEDTGEILNDPALMDRIKEVRNRIAKSS